MEPQQLPVRDIRRKRLHHVTVMTGGHVANEHVRVRRDTGQVGGNHVDHSIAGDVDVAAQRHPIVVGNNVLDRARRAVVQANGLKAKKLQVRGGGDTGVARPDDRYRAHDFPVL